MNNTFPSGPTLSSLILLETWENSLVNVLTCARRAKSTFDVCGAGKLFRNRLRLNRPALHTYGVVYFRNSLSAGPRGGMKPLNISHLFVPG